MARQLFTWVWRNWLYDEHSHQSCRVVKVTGFRSCIVQVPAGYNKYATFYGWPWQNTAPRV